MTFFILTLFPEMFETITASSILKRAREKKIIKIKLVNIRDFTKDKHKIVDDKPYGGGKGMILKVDVLVNALETIKPKPYTVLLSPSGKKYDQQKAVFFSRKKRLSIICGHYEGTDARIEKYVDEVISIGDFILTGGEIAAMAVVDSVARLIP
ncbi:tRNA (guanosine(37)-N1)-methyltransferase TrmD, partial [Candidatus Curtissbacteria bacterium RIFCSPHIGHO2_02_39_8]